MTRILTVEDSRAQRAIISKALAGRGYEIREAEDGVQGLAELGKGPVDLILLDVTMPVMDGPTMLKELRGRGDRTPVILLTAESKTSIIGGMVQDGVDDYILKPFKPEQLCLKVDKILGPRAASGPAEEDEAPATTHSGKPLEDVLVVDDMENVGKRLRRLLPAHMKVSSSVDGAGAVSLCKERLFRAILVDNEMPDVDAQSLVNQLRALQPNAAMVLMVMKNASNRAILARQYGCASHLEKPFDEEGVDRFLSDYFESRDYVLIDDNVLTVSAWAGRNKQFSEGYRKISELIGEEIDKAAAACFESIVVDLSNVEDSPRIVNVLVKSLERAVDMGLELRVVIQNERIASIKAFKETERLPVFSNLGSALSQ
jgi:CheY-like chemotaxis protein